MAVSRELCSNGCSGSGFIDRRATIPLARGSLGAYHDFGDYTIITRCRSLCLLRAVHGNSAWRSGWSDCGQFLRTECAYLRCQRFYPGTSERRCKLESECIPIRGRDACSCAACTAGGISVAHRTSSIRRGVYRPRGGTDIVSGMARTGGSSFKQDVKVFCEGNACKLYICSEFVLRKLTKKTGSKDLIPNSGLENKTIAGREEGCGRSGTSSRGDHQSSLGGKFDLAKLRSMGRRVPGGNYC